MFINQFGINEGKIEILGSRFVMLYASDLLCLQEIDESKMYAFMKGSSKKDLSELINHAKVYKGLKNEAVKNIASLSQKIGKTDEGVVKTLQDLFELYGLGKMKITNLDNKNKKAAIEIMNSTIAFASLKNGKVKKLVCTVTAGILAGIFSFIFKTDVDCIEKKCRASGSSTCSFVVERKEIFKKSKK
jgi:predicted hydrocarbon binding protein